MRIITIAAITILATTTWAMAAGKIINNVAAFAALDKVTGRIEPLDIAIGDTVKFGSLKITAHSCYTRPPTEPPLTSAFIEVDEVRLDGKEEQVFAGWMFAESPGIHAVEHPVFDVWLTDCKTPANDKPRARR
jgi:hypothetical protein